MSRVVFYKYSNWFKQRRPPAFLRSRVIIPPGDLLWAASRSNEFPYRIIQLAFEHGLQAGQLGTQACPYQGPQEVAWIRGYYYASQQGGVVQQINPSLCLQPREWGPVGLATSRRTVSQVINNIDYWCSDIEHLGSEWGRRMRGYRRLKSDERINKPKDVILMPNPWYRDNELNRMHKESGNHHKAHAFTSDTLDIGDQKQYQSRASADKYGKFGSNSTTGLKKNFKVRGSKNLSGFMSKDQLRFHRGYKKLNYDQREILWTYFVPEITQERKLDLLKITQTEYDSLLDLALKAVARKIQDIATLDAQRQTLEAQMNEAASRQTSQEPITQLCPSRIFSYVHKVAINDSRRNPFPICLSLTGHYNPQSPLIEGPIDSNMYYKRPNGKLLTVVSAWEWARLRRQGKLEGHLTDHRNGTNVITLFSNDVPSARPIRILRQKQNRQWLVGAEDDLTHIRILKALEHIAIAGHSPEQDALKAIWGIEKLRGSKEAALDSASGPTYLDNDAYLPAYSSEDSFNQKAMRGFQTPELKILGIQSPEAQLQIKQMLAKFEEKISEAEEQGLTDVCKQHKKDMADFKRLTKGSCIGKKWSRPADDGDIFRSILNDLRQRKRSALDVLRKNGLHDEADDLEDCYEIENRTAIFFASRSRFIWVFDRE